MPAVQHEIDSVKVSQPDLAETTRFLIDVQRRAITSSQPKIASLSFRVEAITPWQVLAIFKHQSLRHFYYDSPKQSMVGIDCAVECSTAGPERFSQAQDFLQFWQAQFVYANQDALGPTASNCRSGHFFCSATFFSAPVSKPVSEPGPLAPHIPHFEPAHLFVPKIQVSIVKTNAVAFSTVTFNCLITASTDVEPIASAIQTKLSKLTSQNKLLKDIRATATSKKESYDDSYRTSHRNLTYFKPAVKAVLEQLQAHHLHKVVLADVLDVENAQVFDEVRSLQTLRQNHPDCIVFSVGNGRGQSFIGASPERLLSISNGRFTTDALAGTVSRGALPGLDVQLAQRLINSEKEQFEHRLVVEFIVDQLRSLGLTPEYDALPKVLQLLHVQHLHTPISASIVPPQSVSPLEILAKLHPTPAVAGVPHHSACELIRQYETFDRGPYAAPIGWIDTNGNSEFVVGIRSALLNGHKARLYAGAGIVAGSEPEKELAEIKLKLQALLNALV
ncbi:MAG: isochorismate synthase [Cyanobacteria bacterium P01_D01_bin.1]